MSFRGFQKSVVRAPQQFKAKFNIGEQVKDPVYTDAERRFQELEKETKKLHDESSKYFNAINGMLQHQINFSQSMTEIYKPISGRMSDPDSLIPEGNPEGIQACEEYENVVKELQEMVAPELEMIETRIIGPANELLDVIKVIQKCANKRNHKKLDFDRHTAAYKKINDKKDRTMKDEKALYKAEGDLEQSTADYNYFNDLLKDELPKLFTLEREFIRPLFQSFYYMQLNIFYTLHEKMQHCDIGYFDLTLDIEAAFEKKRGDIQERTEALSIVKFRTTGQKRPPRYGPKPGQLAIEDGRASSPGSPASPVPRIGYQQADESATDENPPPAYSLPTTTTGTSALQQAAAGKAKPPPPKPKPKNLAGASPAPPAAETVTALYDFAAQAEGDLSFRAGDIIEITQRTGNANEWWTGKVDGRQGQFPGNYVKFD